MAYQSALHRNTNGGNGLQTSTNTLVNNQTQQTTNTNNGTPVAGAQVHLQQVSKSLSTDSMMTIKYNIMKSIKIKPQLIKLYVFLNRDNMPHIVLQLRHLQFGGSLQFLLFGNEQVQRWLIFPFYFY